MPMFLSITLTRSWKDVNHTLRNAGLQCQLCKLQSCKWGHLRRQERRLGWKGLGSGALPSFPSSLGSKHGGGRQGRKTLGKPSSCFAIEGTTKSANFPHSSNWEPRIKGPVTSGTFLAPFPGRVPAPQPGLGPFLHIHSLFAVYTESSGSTV